MAEGKHAVFESAHSVKTPLGVDFGRIGARRKVRAPADRRGIRRRSAGKRRDLQWAARRRGRSSRDATRSGGFLFSDFTTRARTLLGVAAVGFYLDYVQG